MPCEAAAPHLAGTRDPRSGENLAPDIRGGGAGARERLQVQSPRRSLARAPLLPGTPR